MTDLDTLIRRSWPILREAVQMGRTVTYTELAGRAGPPLNRRHLHRQLLIPLSERCRRSGLPDLAALVVRKDTGMPGGGWHVPYPSADPDRAWAEALERCLHFDWPREVPAGLLGPDA
ncbi:hypothetical protein [Tautonia rosea]|uniref:hypothetical protein n=1 Tax=Tautonia rosea TaxID=2728037 RepID=UPI0014746A8B|nr:hypothetical protein [Tautonia rosea]